MSDQIKILAISSQVVDGRVGLRAIAPVFENFGIDVHTLPSVSLTWHPGRGPATRAVNTQFQNFLDDLAKISQFDAVLTGYFDNAEQVKQAASFIKQQKRLNSHLIYCCDPVLGDDGALYVDADTAAAICDELIPLADILTPNLFELMWITGSEVEQMEQAMEASVALTTKPAEVLVSSAPAEEDGLTAIIVTQTPGWQAVTESDEPVVSVQVMKHQQYENVPNGTGDMLAAVYLALRLLADDVEEALSGATFVVHEMVALADHYETTELPIAQALGPIIAELIQKREGDVPFGFYEDDDDDELEEDFEEEDIPPSKLH